MQKNLMSLMGFEPANNILSISVTRATVMTLLQKNLKDFFLELASPLS